MIDPVRLAFYIPPHLKDFKLRLFERIALQICQRGGRCIRHDVDQLANLAPELVPIVGCTPALRPLIDAWIANGRDWIYWDRGYCRRVFATWLPRGENGGYYRWHLNSYQLQKILDVSNDRWQTMNTKVEPWRRGGRHILIAAPSRTYQQFHRIETWLSDTVDALARITDRQLVIRDKESKRPLQADLADAHCCVTHGSNTAVEAVILGTPVFVHPCSAAALVGRTDLKHIETPTYPERQPWLNSLAYSQFTEFEMCAGKVWKALQ